MTVQANITFWMIRPSESAALDIVSIITALGGTTGNVETEYKGFTSKIDYYLLNRDKMICVIAQKTPETMVAASGVLTTINCYSAPFVIESTTGIYYPPSGEAVDLIFDKWYEEPFVKVASIW